MSLTRVEESLLVAAYFRGGGPDDRIWTSNSDQVVTLSLFITGDISSDDCVERFSRRSYVRKLYAADGELNHEISQRYQILIALIHERSELITGGGNYETPADPTYTARRMTELGMDMAASLIESFPRKPDFPNWPDKRIHPDPQT